AASHEICQSRPAAISGWNLLAGDLFAGTRNHSARCPYCAGSRRSLSLRTSAADRPRLPGNRTLRSAAPLDGSQGYALLPFLPGLVRFLFFPFHREAEPVRLDDLLGQGGSLAVAASLISAFRPDIPGEERFCPQAPLGCCGDLRSPSVPASPARERGAMDGGYRASAARSGPH